jgi:hypothetical protein
MFCSKRQMGKKKCADCIVHIVHTDADVADRMTHGRVVRHMEGSYDTWQMLVGKIVDELAYDTCHRWRMKC